MTGAMRLQRYLAQSGVASRRRAEELIRRGEVRVNGAEVMELGYRVDAENDRVEVQGRRVRPTTPMYRLLLKPRSCLATLTAGPSAGVPERVRPPGVEKTPARAAPVRTRASKAAPRATSDGAPKGRIAPNANDRPTLDRYVPDREVGWQVVAPLDFPAEGVLLLTTDGELAQAMGRGGGRVPMTYHIKYQGTVRDEEIGRLLRGWRWNRRPVRPESVVGLATTGKNTWLEIVVRESRARVLKASGEAIRKSVLKISRVKLGPLSFEGLSLGQSRDLSRAEVNALRRAAKHVVSQGRREAPAGSSGPFQGLEQSDNDPRVIARALLSVSDKTGLLDLGQRLERLGVELLSTGGTASALRGAGVGVREIATSPAPPRCSTVGSRRCTRASTAASWVATPKRTARKCAAPGSTRSIWWW